MADIATANPAQPVRRSATEGLVRPLVSPADPGLRLAEIPHEAKLNLRGDAGDAGFTAAVRGVLGLDLPARPGAAGAEGLTALWLGPNEWLVVGGVDREADLADRLNATLVGQFAAVTNVSDNWTVIVLTGPKVLDVLAKGCPLDLHPRALPAGSVAQSMLSQADVILHRLDDADGTFKLRLYIRRSFAQYAWDWLADAGLEYGVGTAA
jgi:sarcosine oxidase subunit gamma